MLRFSVGLFNESGRVQGVGREMESRRGAPVGTGAMGFRGWFIGPAILSAGLAGVLMLSGCGVKTSQMQHESVASERMETPAAMVTPVSVGWLADATIGKAIEAHAAGDIERGIALFVAAAESDDIEAMKLNPMSEAEFAAEYTRLPPSDREAMHEAILEQVMQARYLVNDVIRLGDQALESGEEASALRYYQAVRAFGQINREQRAMLVVKMTAEAIEAGALARISRLDLP